MTSWSVVRSISAIRSTSMRARVLERGERVGRDLAARGLGARRPPARRGASPRTGRCRTRSRPSRGACSARIIARSGGHGWRRRRRPMSWRRWRPGAWIRSAAAVGGRRAPRRRRARDRRPQDAAAGRPIADRPSSRRVPAWKISAPRRRGVVEALDRVARARLAGIARGRQHDRDGRAGRRGSRPPARRPSAAARSPRAAASSSGPSGDGKPRQDACVSGSPKPRVALEQDSGRRRSASGRRRARHGTGCRGGPARPGWAGGSARGASPAASDRSGSGQGTHAAGVRAGSPSSRRLWSRASGRATASRPSQTAMRLASVVVEERLDGPRGKRHRHLRRARRGRAAGGARPQAACRRRRGTEHRWHGRLPPAARPADEAVDELLDAFHRPILDELARRGAVPRRPLRGPDADRRRPASCSSATRASATPRRRSIMPRLAVSLGPILLAAARGHLADGSPTGAGGRLPVLPGATVAIVLAAAGYPEAPRPGDADRGAEADAADRRPHLPRGDAARRDGGVGRRRPRPRRGRAGRRPRRRRGRPPSLAADRIHAAGIQRRHDIGRGVASPRAAWRPPDDPALHARPRWARSGPTSRGSRRCSGSSSRSPAPSPPAARSRPRRSPRSRRARAVDVERIAEIERTTDHDVIAFVSQVAETVGPEGRYLHLGLTSSDVVDTGLALQLRAAGERLLLDCDRLLAVLIGRARAEAGTVMMGRTHSVHAEPTTFGLKLAGWAFELERGRGRLAAAVDEIATGKISGPVGTYSHLGPDIEAEVLGRARSPRGSGQHPDRPARPSCRRC